MKVIIEKNGINAHSVNDKAIISHKIAQKTELSKKSGGRIENQQVRTVGGTDKAVNSPSATTHQKNRLKDKHLKLAPRKKYKVLKNGELNTGAFVRRNRHIIHTPVSTANKLKKSKSKKLAAAGVLGTKKVYRIAKKPVELLKREFYAKTDKEETGTSAVKLGVQTYDYAGRTVKTAAEMGIKTVKNGTRLTKQVTRKIHKTTGLKKTLRKRVFRNKLKTQVNHMAKQAVRKGAKAAGKAAANVASKTAKAIVNAVSKVVSLIVETMPWSLIIIGVVLLVLLIVLMFGSLLGGASGSVAGGGAWLVDDNITQTPEEIYESYQKFVEQTNDVMKTQTKDALKDEVSSFCASDTRDPRKIIQYIDKNNNRTLYPAKGADSTISPIIDQFTADDYADYMSLLFVLMTREKQQADGVTDDTIYDFDFKKEDFEEFMKTVNENSCRWGDTFVIKTAVETSAEYCPGQNCKTKTKPGCKCDSYTDEEGKVHEYCKGHPYCPQNHTKLTVKLYTVKDYYGKDYPEIYNFTENEKTRYEASKIIIQEIIDYWEGGSN